MSNLTEVIRQQMKQIDKLKAQLTTHQAYINSMDESLDKMTRPFCDNCPAVKVDFGYFNPLTGDVRPPDSSCSVDWNFGTEGCLALTFWKEGLERWNAREAEEIQKRCEEEEDVQ